MKRPRDTATADGWDFSVSAEQREQRELQHTSWSGDSLAGDAYAFDVTAHVLHLWLQGNAARYIAKYRPDQPIVVGVVPLKRRATIGFDSSNGTPEAQVARQCLLTRGLIPVIVTDRSEVRTPLHLPTLSLQLR
jgi:hypothetical protein